MKAARELGKNHIDVRVTNLKTMAMSDDADSMIDLLKMLMLQMTVHTKRS